MTALERPETGLEQPQGVAALLCGDGVALKGHPRQSSDTPRRFRELVRPACWTFGQRRANWAGCKTLQRVHAEAFGRPCKRCFGGSA